MPRGRPKKSAELTVIPTINSYLTLQLALRPEFAKRDLPELTISHDNKAIYLSGPCGQQLCKVFYTGTTKITTSDFPIIFDQILIFLDKHLDMLSRLFTLRKQLKEYNLVGIYFGNGGKNLGSYVSIDSRHPDYNKYLNKVYENRITTNEVLISDDELNSLDLREAIKTHRAHLANHIHKNNMQAEANKIIVDLSNCTI